MRPDDVVAMLDHMSDGVFVFDADWHFRYINEAGAHLLGQTPDKLMGVHAWTEFPDAIGGPSFTAYHRAQETNEPQRITEYYAPLGREFEVRIWPHEGELIVVFRDITDIGRVERELREYAERMSIAERIAQFGVWKWDIAADTLVFSAELHRLFGTDPVKFGGNLQAFQDRLAPDEIERVTDLVNDAMRRVDSFLFELRIIRPDGEGRTLLVQGRVIPGPDGRAASLVGVCHDITQRVQAERALGVSERRLRAVIDYTPSVVAVKDLDGRYVMANAEAGRILGLSADQLIGRHCTELFPPDVAQQLRANDHTALAEGRPILDETVLIGENGEPRNYMTVTFPLPDADGRPNEVCTIGTDVTDRRALERDRAERREWGQKISEAIDEDRMVVFAQPIVALSGAEGDSSELLVRMRTPGPNEELLLPAAFLPVAERHGFVQPIDTWVVRQALSLAATQRLAVNLSAVSLSDRSARREIVALLAGNPAAAGNITFEITETAAMEHLEAACEFADLITALGVGLALDDFGTGFGSFTYLRRLPLRYLKIDRTFVIGMASSVDDQRVVQSVIGIARQFGLETIAEGVEDAEALEMLREFGAGYAQGFHIGRPAPVSALSVASTGT